VPEIKIPEKRFFILLLLTAVVIVSLPVIYYKGWYGTYFSTNKVELVQGFPQVPSYPGSRLLVSGDLSNSGGFLYKAEWSSRDSLPVISKWFRERLTAEGWVLESGSAEGEENLQLVVFSRGSVLLKLSLIKEKKTSKIVIELQNTPDNEEEEEME
jgi:hypothetical protein